MCSCSPTSNGKASVSGCSIILGGSDAFNSIKPARYKFFRQGVSITGAGTAIFNDATKAAQEIYAQFYHQFPDKKLEAWSMGTYAGHPALDVTNRYFTPKRDAPEMQHIPFNNVVDPRSILEDMARAGYIHGEDNNVLYYICHVNEQGERR